jgi:hypothetical protein
VRLGIGCPDGGPLGACAKMLARWGISTGAADCSRTEAALSSDSFRVLNRAYPMSGLGRQRQFATAICSHSPSILSGSAFATGE